MIIKVVIGIIGYVVLVLLTICFCIVIITKTLNFLSKSFVGVPLSEACHRLVEKENSKKIETTENKKIESQYALKNTIEMNPLSYSVNDNFGAYYFKTKENRIYGVIEEDLFFAMIAIRKQTSSLIISAEFSRDPSLERETIFTYQGITLEEMINPKKDKLEDLPLGIHYGYLERTEPLEQYNEGTMKWVKK